MGTGEATERVGLRKESSAEPMGTAAAGGAARQEL